MFLLILSPSCSQSIKRGSLHSTMFLLIRRRKYEISKRNHFTFHNVSINTAEGILFGGEPDNFTFHNVSINTTTAWQYMDKESTLHSTMFLLIPFLLLQSLRTERSLHSTMFLLIRKLPQTISYQIHSFTFHNVSINTELGKCVRRRLLTLHSTMFLLILLRIAQNVLKTIFTFHNVSINTRSFDDYIIPLILYIPQCFY